MLDTYFLKFCFIFRNNKHLFQLLPLQAKKSWAFIVIIHAASARQNISDYDIYIQIIQSFGRYNTQAHTHKQKK